MNRATDFFKRQYSNRELVFSVDGFVSLQKSMVAIGNIETGHCVGGIGVPQARHYVKAIGRCVALWSRGGVGGVFDVWAGAVSRAPWAFRRLGLEWLFRLIKNRAVFWLDEGI